ncbi:MULTISPECIES: nucleotidyltransferase family protein [unclassified Burkholderia]|uniref:nucleotidyltransferase family protein n=1 Tax=unclassified Burkholderia TaxID=2613784 RepID=UPI000F55D201|nr:MULTISPECIES: nucleotidyltransferase domain-containing protein [unclassified Burkholderia]RQR72678.1 nucleotidyltransferase domain-containing protein [Burkholderia sp. Bp9012]RQR83947.1 nucleotidyltransferase domain-containing protein [Burkholderia sp. Bp9011]RQR94377.1 nucleotidyltransferase domain-containing protein [Burkholderia sp. Bp9010]RQZ45394.1 nucleotidyltransferase domain-containing protein [Burkholderia sp. Bp9099]
MDVAVDPETAHAADVFLKRIAQRYPVRRAILFGSRARHEHTDESDADIAVILSGGHGERTDIVLDMAGTSFDVLLETGVLVGALPIWEDELEHPERFSNPVLIENIRREGIPL